MMRLGDDTAFPERVKMRHHVPGHIFGPQSIYHNDKAGAGLRCRGRYEAGDGETRAEQRETDEAAGKSSVHGGKNSNRANVRRRSPDANQERWRPIAHVVSAPHERREVPAFVVRWSPRRPLVP